jgi:type II secretory pathway component PulK
MVRGVDEKIFQYLRPYVTVYTDGKINFNSASAVVFQALGMGSSLARKVVAFRQGEDGRPGTGDDRVFQTPDAITADITTVESLSSEEVSQVANVVTASGTVKSDIFRIHASSRLIIGKGKTVDNMMNCVVKRDGTFLYWQEGVR